MADSGWMVARLERAKEEIGWLKLLLVLVFTASVSWTGWMVENLSWPLIPENLGAWEAFRKFAEDLELLEVLALAVEVFLLLVMLSLGIEIRMKINKLGELDEHRDR